jgi:hypothetical protein
MTPEKPNVTFSDAILAVFLPYLTTPATLAFTAATGGPLSGSGELPPAEASGEANS